MEAAIYLLVIMCLLHWLGDFVFQSDELAFGKHRNFWGLIVHSCRYSLPFLFVGLFLSGIGFFNITIIASILFTIMTFFTHLATDHLISGLGYKELTKNSPNIFLGILMFDQLIHLGTLILTFVLLF